MENWISIILALLSGTTVASVVEAIRYRQQNKKIKDSEATISDVEAQKSKLDLITKVKDEMLSMVEIVKQANEKSFANQDEIITKLGRLDERLENLEIETSNITTYLNGPYHQWLAEKENNKNN